MAAKRFISLLAMLAITMPCTTLVRAATSETTDTSDGCQEAYDACYQDETCLECITLSVSSSTQTTCEEAYYDDSITQCGYEAISYCCQSETSAMAQCVQDETTTTYWSCVLEEVGCSLDDMPCINLQTPAPVTTQSPTSMEIDDDSETNWAVGTARPSRMMYAYGVGVMAAVVGIMM